MARPPKQGLDFFPLDVNCFEDERLTLLEVEHGDRGIAMWFQLLTRLYRVGLCFRWDDRARAVFAAQTRRKLSDVDAVLASMLEFGLFSKQVFNETGFLTSKGIQRRFFCIVGNCRRQSIRIPAGVMVLSQSEIPSNLNIIIGDSGISASINRVNVDGNQVNACENSNSIDKDLKERKEKESKEKETHIPACINSVNVDGNSQVAESSLTTSNGNRQRSNSATTTITQIATTIPTVSICLNESLTAKGLARVEEQNAATGLPEALNDKSTSDQFDTMAEIRLESPGEQPWTKANAFILGGRRPMKKYPGIQITKPDLAEVFRSWTRSSIPQDRWKEILMAVESKLRSYQEQGRPTDAVNPFNWLIGWARADMVKLLGDEARHDKFSEGGR